MTIGILEVSINSFCIMRYSQKPMEGQGVEYGSLHENGPNIFFVWIFGLQLLEVFWKAWEMCPLFRFCMIGMDFKISKVSHYCQCFLYFLLLFWDVWLQRFALSCSIPCSWSLILWICKPNWILSFINYLGHSTLYSNREAPNTDI